MIKRVLHTSFSVILAFLVLFSTVCLTIEKHFCGDVLVAVSVFSEGAHCGVDALGMEHDTLTKINCCKSHIDVIQGQNILAFNTYNDVECVQQLFLTSYMYSLTYPFKGLLKQNTPYKEYAPPKLIVDIHVVHNIFLI